MTTRTPSPTPGAGSERAPAPQAPADPSDGVAERLREVLDKHSVQDSWGGPVSLAKCREIAAALAPAQGPAAGVAEPVAWRVRDYTNTWTLHRAEADAIDEANGTGTKVEPLYAAPPPGPAPSGDAVLRRACEPWEFHVGEPPAYSSPLSSVYGAGMTYMTERLAKLLKVDRYDVGDGSEDFGQDATTTLANILIAAGRYDPEDGRWASLAPPADAPAAGAGLAGVEAALKKLVSTVMSVGDGAMCAAGMMSRDHKAVLDAVRDLLKPPADVAGLVAHYETALIRECDGASRLDQGSPKMERLREATITARSTLDSAIAALARGAHGGSAGVGVSVQSVAVQEVSDDKILALLAIASAARDWAGNDCDPKDWSERALFVALFDAFPEDFPGRENCGCDQSEMACDECPSIHEIRANIAKWRAEGAASRSRIEAEDRARPASGATGEGGK